MTDSVQVQVPLKAFVSAQEANMRDPDKMLTVESTTRGGNRVRPVKDTENSVVQKEQLEMFKEALKAQYSDIDATFFDNFIDGKEGLTPNLIKDAVAAADAKEIQDHKEKIGGAKELFRTHSNHTVSTVGTEAAELHLRSSDFKPTGVTEAEAKTWLTTSDGQEFMQMLNYIEILGDHEFQTTGLSKDKQTEIALELIMSGAELPSKTEFSKGDVLVKITTSSQLGQHSLYFTTEEALKDAITGVDSGEYHSIASAFGLPVGSVNGDDSYVMHKVTVTNDCVGWSSIVAPTHEVKEHGETGKLHTSGGALQTFVGRNNTEEVAGEKAEVTRNGINADRDGEAEVESAGLLDSLKAMIGWK